MTGGFLAVHWYSKMFRGIWCYFSNRRPCFKITPLLSESSLCWISCMQQRKLCPELSSFGADGGSATVSITSSFQPSSQRSLWWVKWGGGPCIITSVRREPLLTACVCRGVEGIYYWDLSENAGSGVGYIPLWFLFWSAVTGRDLKICQTRIHFLFLKPLAGEKLGIQGQSSTLVCLLTLVTPLKAAGGTQLIKTGNRNINRDHCGHVYVCIQRGEGVLQGS